MKISIITVTYNSAKTIRDTINSVISQDYHDLEYIIVDGKSTDNTLSIVKEYTKNISKIVSEPDKGMYDAINKGIELASGDVIGILNSDDFYIDKDVLSDVMEKFSYSNADAVYADLYYVDTVSTNKIIRHWRSGKYNDGDFLKGWMPPHPAFFVKKSCYEKYGKFNLKLKSAADYELMLRFIHKYKIKLSYLERVVVKMRLGGMSNSSINNRIKANKEDRKAWEINGLKPEFYTLYLKPLRKILQYFQ